MSLTKSNLDKEHVLLCIFATVFFAIMIGIEIHFNMEWYVIALTVWAWYLQLKVFKADIRMRKACTQI
jgi:hypothetical protein